MPLTFGHGERFTLLTEPTTGTLVARPKGPLQPLLLGGAAYTLNEVAPGTLLIKIWTSSKWLFRFTKRHIDGALSRE